ncbi:MAG: hypothetical protein VXZ24_12470 [Pseudomonadota bacterium]|nr:hypothetical protein [Pseudomonadota bacterium]
MQASHQEVLERYDVFREQARDLAYQSLPRHLKNALTLAGIDHKALNAFATWRQMPERQVDWDWEFSRGYKTFYPKAFDLSVWEGNRLSALSLGRPTYHGTEMRLDFVERVPGTCLYAGDMFSISLLAYETYASLIGAKKIRIMNPLNDVLVKYYMSHGGFTLMPSKKGNPRYLVRDV